MGVEMSREEACEFIAEAHTAILTTLRRDGSAVPLPLWFAVLDGQIYVRTLAGSAKMRRLRNDPRVAFLVESGLAWAELKAVLISGTGTVVEDEELCERIERELNRKYERYQMPQDAPDVTRRHYASQAAYVRIDPDTPPLSWDNRKIRRSAPVT
jgi:PPOX class probable F420-dependent enzyme